MAQYEFSQNRSCEYFPCHKVKDEASFNCLFCFCPLYLLHRECGGNFTYLEMGIKDCSACTLVHSPKGYAHVMDKMSVVVAKIKQQEKMLNES